MSRIRSTRLVFMAFIHGYEERNIYRIARQLLFGGKSKSGWTDIPKSIRYG